MSPNLVSSDVLNNNFIKEREFEALLYEFYVLLIFYNIKDEHKIWESPVIQPEERRGIS